MFFPQSSTSSFSYPFLPPLRCRKTNKSPPSKARVITLFIPHRKLCLLACAIPTSKPNKLTVKVAKSLAVKGFKDEFANGESQESSVKMGSSFANFRQDPIVDKLRTQLGVIHPIPSPPINRNIVGLFVFFFFVGVAFDKIWTARKRRGKSDGEGVRMGGSGVWPQVPTSFSLFLEKDLQRKESVEWVNMVLGKLLKVYRGGIENWIIGLLQPVIDNLKKPDYVQRVEIKQFSLGDEPLSVRNVERRTSRRDNDLQYQIGIRYTGGARMLLMLSLKFGIIPFVVPVGVRDFDIDGELWVKLRLIPKEPFVGAVSWAFVSLPKINPKKIVLDFQKGKAVGPVPSYLKPEEIQEEKNKDFAGELSVTLVDARKLSYVFYGKTDPYVVLTLGDQVIRSKKNSQTTVIGPPGEPIWNQDFYLLVANPGKEKLRIQVKDSLGFTDWAIGTGEVDLGTLQDTVPTDKIVTLQGGWGLFGKRSRGEILLRLTYKAYVEDEEDDTAATGSVSADFSDDELSDFDEPNLIYEQGVMQDIDEASKESFMDVLAALIVSEEFQGIVSSEPGSKNFDDLSRTGSSKTRLNGVNTESAPSDSDEGSEPSGGTTLLWFAVITSTLVLIALNMGGSGFFNP
ncbi:Calcium-dependent lipid-binding (CaLB domain) family protein isoform 2 [Hibiscus syriacus]|uniref:Calcium-dependent lipid-binding (CaLB domain) family protein isoform 2 n=1 Tax=Hibiscus syriacus TaxID=106335 RepID=A0A6A3BW33_HIBSY|nr:Calcium-dependent lipid-binding (CaLB domain) family protein isoform 2 [Hibiscus syriacus]